jgi:dGTPase
VREILGDIRRRHPSLDAFHTAHELVRRLITCLIEDVIAEAGERLAALAPHCADDVRHAAAPVGGFSPAMAEADRAIKGFLYPRMYRHARIARIMSEAEAVVRDLFARYAASPQDIPADWAHGAEPGEEATRLRRIADFIAGMTDRYALVEHARLFEQTPELR